MATDLTQYKVFIASPGGLERERKAFKKVIEEYNEQEALDRNILFRAIGWEETLGGIGRPQSLINKELEKCDYFIMILHDRWGTDPGESEKKATSGTHEEYLVALECYAKEQLPMKQVIVLFKAVPPNQMSDPGKELTKVLAFRKEIEKEKKLLYATFSSVREFQSLLRKNLAHWNRENNKKELPPEKPLLLAESTAPYTEESTLDTPDLPAESKRSAADEKARELINQAWNYANNGQLTQAEIHFSKALVCSPKPYQITEFARFLTRLGRLDQALSMLDDAIQISEEEKEKGLISSALNSKALILERRGDLDGAEEMHKKSLLLEEELGRKEGIAVGYCNLGMTLGIRGDLDGAEEMHKKSLLLSKELGYKEGMAANYGNLGLILKMQGDLNGAEEMHKKSLLLNEELGRKEGMARQYCNLGLILKIRGDLDGAEEMHKKSLLLSEELGSKEGVVRNYSNLGVILQMRGDLNGAEEMHKKSLLLSEELGSKEGIARQYGNLGVTLQARGDLDGAEAMLKKAKGIIEKKGYIELFTQLEAMLDEIIAEKAKK